MLLLDRLRKYKIVERNMKKPTPMQRQYLELKKQHPDSILLFRLGDFYEMFNEDAKEASEVLNIVLTSRGEGVNKWPLCGVPHHSVDNYWSQDIP